MEHVWRDKLDSRELIAQMIATAPPVKEIPTKIPIEVFERLLELAGDAEPYKISKAYSDNANDILNKIRFEIMDTGAFEKEVNGKTEFLRGLTYCLGVIDKIQEESEE
jgi:uncharacterized protein with ATP-grasp and redox domains